MKLGTHANTLTIVLMLLITGLAGCIGEGEAETEQQTIAIAGSSAVFPVASARAKPTARPTRTTPLPWPAVDLVQAPPRCAAPMPMP